MAVHNINMLQNQEDVKYLIGDIESGENTTIHYPTDNEKDFYIQSLANMGQRVGTHTSGIKYNSSTIGKLFNISNDDIISIQYVKDAEDILRAKIEKVNTSEDFSSTNDYSSQLNIDYNSSNIYNKYFFKNIEEFSIPINNIEKYQKDSIIYDDGEYIVMCLNGKILGTDDEDENNVEIQYTKINTSTGIVDTVIRAFYLGNNTYIMLILKPDEFDDIDQQYNYKLLVTSFNLSNLEEEYDNPNAENNLIDIKQYIKNAFSWSECINVENNPFAFKYLGIDITTATLDEILDYDKTKFNFIYSENTIFGLIQNYATYHGEIEDKYFVSDVQYNSSTDSELSFTDDTKHSQDYNMQYNLLINDVYGLEGRLVAINNDIKYTYPNILSIYSRNKYDENRTTIFIEILYTLYEHLCKSYKDKETLTEYPILYIPGSYVIEYMYNSIDYKFYYTNDIFVTFVNKEDYTIYNNGNEEVKVNDIINNLNVIKFVYDEEEKVSCYKFIVKYNEQYEDSIDTIYITEEYTLPYINSSNNWQINDRDSKLSAVGTNAGNPNIIITRVDNGEGTILVGANYEILKSFDWEIKKYIENDKELYAYIPIVNKASAQYLENAIIINTCKDNDDYYSSLWTINKNMYKYENNDSDTYEFTCVVNEDGSPLNIDKLFALDSNIKEIISTNNYLNVNTFTDIIINSAKNTILNSSAEASDYLKCHIHGELNAKDEDNDNLNTTINNNDAIIKIEYEKDKNYYLDIISGINEDIVVKDTLNNANYPKYELVTYKYVDNSYVAYISELSNLSSLLATNTSDSDIVDYIVENADYYYNVSSIEEQDLSYLYYVNESSYNYSYEYLLANSTPSILLSEMLLQDVNVVNRTNILTLDKVVKGNEENAIIYNSYIGSSFDDKNKNILHIGSCSTNVNLGTDTLIEPGYNQHLHVQDTLSLDLKYTYIQSNVIKQNAFPIVSEELNNTTYNFVSPQIISNVPELPLILQYDSDINAYTLSSSISQISSDPIQNMAVPQDIENNNIFKGISTNGSETGNAIETGSIFINTLMIKYCNINIHDYENVNLTVHYTNKTSSMSTDSLEQIINDIYCIQYKNLNRYYIYVSVDEQLETGVKYVHTPIYIMWYIKNNKLYIDLNLGSAGYTDSKRFKTYSTNVTNSSNPTVVNHHELPTINDQIGGQINIGVTPGRSDRQPMNMNSAGL